MTEQTDPTDDRLAFIGSALACALLLAGLVLADAALSVGTRSTPPGISQVYP